MLSEEARLKNCLVGLNTNVFYISIVYNVHVYTAPMLKNNSFSTSIKDTVNRMPENYQYRAIMTGFATHFIICI